MSKKVITSIVLVCMIMSVFSTPVLGYGATLDSNDQIQTSETKESDIINIISGGETDEDQVITNGNETVSGEEGLTAGKDSINVEAVTGFTTTAVKSDFGAIKVSWKNSSNVTGYEIYRYSDLNEQYIQIIKIKNVQSPSIVDIGLQHNKEYSYKIRAYKIHEDEIYYGAFSEVSKAVTLLPDGVTDIIEPTEPTEIASETESGETSEPSSNIDEQTTEPTQMTESTSEEQTEATEPSETPATEESSIVTEPTETTKPSVTATKPVIKAKPIVKAGPISRVYGKSTSYRTIKISWRRSSNAKMYEVYRRAAGQPRYTRIRVTSAIQLTNTGLSGNKKYSYRVRAYNIQNGKKYYGAFTRITTVKTKMSGPQKVVAKANTKVGAKYRYGASGPKKFDCSGLVYWVYKKSHVKTKKKVKRTSSAGMYKALKKYKVASGIKGIKKAKAGDIILFKRGGRYSHAAIYVGNGKIIHATTPRRGVVKEKVTKVHKSGTRVAAIIRVVKN